MSRQRVDPLTSRIGEKLAILSSTYSEQCIFRVHDQLRKENEEAYEPTIVAIGPYHRGKNKLKAMEEHKFRYLRQVIQLNNELGVDRYVTAMRDLEERARKCYAESVDLTTDEFVEMMLLDGCFIVQFVRHHMSEHVEDDPLFQYSPTHKNISLDLMLLENQLPFFVLNRLFDMTKTSNQDYTIMNLVLTVFNDLSQPNSKVLDARPRTSGDHVDHILGVMHEIWCSSFAKVLSQRRKGSQNEKWEFIKCTTQLQEAGVKLKASSQTRISLLDITFENGVIEIPPFTIKDNTERLLRNLIAYEQYRPSGFPKFVTDYVVVMDYLINSEKDVEILRHNGIIKSWLGDDEAVSVMFNKLCTKVWISKNFCYAEVFNRLNQHCRKRRNVWLANLRRNYFSSPWSIISFIVAVVLLLLTLTQAIFSVLSYSK